MKINSVDHFGYRVFDCNDRILGYVQEYDTDSKEVTAYLPNSDSFESNVISELVDGVPQPKKITFVLKGSYALDPEGNKI